VTVSGDEPTAGSKGEDLRVETVDSFSAAVAAIPDGDLHGLRTAINGGSTSP
jgi:hypothetical protein